MDPGATRQLLPAEHLVALRAFLDANGPGSISDAASLVGSLSSAWDELDGSDEAAMAARKVGRVESPEWRPPILSFEIERHGATVNGSSRAEVQLWHVDLDRRTADIVGTTHRQLRRMAPRLKVEPLVTEIMALIDAGSDDPRLKWSPDHAAVRVILSKVIPPDSGATQTVQGRQRRLRDAWRAAMTNAGWVQVDRAGMFRRE